MIEYSTQSIKRNICKKKSLSIDVQFHYIYVSSFKLIQLFYKKLTVQELEWGLSN